MTNPQRIAAVLPAAGQGSRMQTTVAKQFLQINGQTMLQHSIAAVLQDKRVEHVFVAINTDNKQPIPSASADVSFVQGGQTRAESVLSGVLHAMTQGFSHVVVHDAARPGLPADVLSAVIDAGTVDDNGAIVAMPVRDSLKRSEPDHQIVSTQVSRDGLWQAQTPQVFAVGLLADAISEMGITHDSLTDEAAAMECLGYHPKLVMGSLKNLKVTHPEDLELMTALLKPSPQ
ncbi:2-C-methyl-D-erythritol 4-phosphate cytidylyltransferase [Idiomarina seosinensis]|uniref:2-C-methyl-D-erythritol 4-phosphate cytidylyltransferase n=1 Tax=Idiomarina seosinensis TaxID=281739 RepID=UPI0038501E19